MRLSTSMIAACLALSCGSGSPTTPTNAAHSLPSTVMIMATGVTPNDVTIAVGERVTFMNHDTVSHGVAGGSEPSKPDCPEINAVGMLAPGEIRQTAPFLAAKTCEYHNPRMQSAAFNGRITVR